MGRKNKSYSKDLHQQAYDKLTGMQAFGQSKKDAVANGTEQDKLFSYNTYKTYWKHTKYFTKWIQEQHPECTTLKAARKHVNEWLQSRVDQVNDKGQHLSAWTVRDSHFSVTNNDELIRFCRGTGCRRNVLERLEGRDLWSRDVMESELSMLSKNKNKTAKEEKHMAALQDALKTFPDQDMFIHHRKDKNGRYRFAPIIGPDKEQIIARMRNTGYTEKVWLHVNGNADIHGYRAEYATAMYKKYARDIKDIPYDRVNKGTGRRFQGDVYTCRKDESGKKLDKAAMLLCSKALGHNRISVVADNYIRGL